MLLWLLSALLVLVALLAIPLRISLAAQAGERQRFQVHVQWLFGLVAGPLRASPDATSPKRRSSRTPKQRWTFQQTMVFVRAAGGAERARQALRDLIASLRPQIECMRIGLGFDDPADTGRAFAFLAPVAAWLAWRYGRIEVAPSFAEPALTVDGRAHFTIVPLQTLGIIIGYAMSFKTLHAFYLAQRC